MAIAWLYKTSRVLPDASVPSLILQKSGFRLGEGQYRNAVASGQFSNIRYSEQI